MPPSVFKKAVHEAWAASATTSLAHATHTHVLQQKLGNAKKGTHPEIRSKLDPHLIDVVRTTHSHLLDDVHGDIIGGIIEDRIARQLDAMKQMTMGGSSTSAGAAATTNANAAKRTHDDHHAAHTDLEAYAERMFNVASVMMHDGAADRNFISHKYDRRSLWFYDLQRWFGYQFILILSHVLLCGLVLFEVPALPALATPASVTLPVEVTMLIVQSVDIAVRMQALRHPRSERWLVVKSVVTVLCTLDCVVQMGCAASGWCGGVAFYVRALRSLRVVFWVEYVPVLRNEFTQTLETIRRILPALFLLAVIIVFYGGVAIALFPRGDLAASVGVDATEGDLYFTDIQTAIVQLFYLFAGAVNFPDISMPAILQNNHIWWYQIISLVYFLSFIMKSLVHRPAALVFLQSDHWRGLRGTTFFSSL